MRLFRRAEAEGDYASCVSLARAMRDLDGQPGSRDDELLARATPEQRAAFDHLQTSLEEWRRRVRGEVTPTERARAIRHQIAIEATRNPHE